MIIDAKKFSEFAKAKGISIACPACHSDDMVLLTVEADRTLAIMDISLSTPDINDMRPAHQLSLECKNCGYGRFFRREAVAKWLESQNG